MSSNTLDELGRTILEVIAAGRVTVDEVASTANASRDAIDERLAQLADNALIRAVDDSGGQAYEITENGERVLAATPIGARDDRIDIPDDVERAIEKLSLRPDEAAAIRGAFSFLRYWGEATSAEVIDAIYTEVPAGYGSADRWWDDGIRDRLAALPRVGVSPDDWVGERWRYEGPATIDRPEDADGRDVPDPPSTAHVAGSARHAFASVDLSADELTAARAAFAALVAGGRLTEADLLDSSGISDDMDEWVARLDEMLSTVPSVSVDRSGDEPVWRYRPPDSARDPD
ncbi:hypothetical protein OB905_08475 [Halobacteria archaeon AArc-dxtr1]|nr:hypothetical protein [Halobacteria archaeon AArc-dxtr1]